MALDDIAQNDQNDIPTISLKTSTPFQEKEAYIQYFSISPDKSPALYELDKRFMQLKLKHFEHSADSIGNEYQLKSCSNLKSSTSQNSDDESSHMKWPYHDPHNYRIVKNNSSIDDLSRLFKSNLDVSSVKSKYGYMGEYFQTSKKIVRRHNVRIRI